MNFKSLTTLSAALLVSIFSSQAANLTATATVTPDNGNFDYSYQFTISGGNVDNIFLGSNDLSPLNLTIQVDNSLATNWSWLGNDTPQNYLQFFSTDGSSLTDDVLGVTFTSPFAPGSQFAVGEYSADSSTTNTITGLGGPTSIPEPANFGIFGLALLGTGFVLRRKR